MIVNRFIAAAGFKVKVGVHVGAHRATEAKRYEALGVERLIWFEADDRAAQWARETLAGRPRGATAHTLVEALVTDRDGVETEFHVFSNDGASSSIFRATDRLRAEWPKLRETGEVKLLRSSRLDTLLGGLGVEPADVGMLVFDVQGAELLGLKGAGRYLDAATFVEVEMSQEEIYAGGALAPEVHALLIEQGFAQASEIPWHGDAVYVRLDRLTEAQRSAIAEAPALT